MRRWLLIPLALLVLVLVVFVVARRTLETDWLRGVAEAELGRILGQPVQIGSIDVDLVPRPVVTGSDIRIGGGTAAAGAAPPLALGSLLIVPDLRSVLGGPLAISRVELERLTLTVGRDAEGRWHFPVALGASPGTAAAAGAGALRLERVTLRDGTIRIEDAGTSGQPVRALTVSAISATLTAEDSGRSLSDLTARIGASEVTGSGRLDSDGLALDLTWGRIDDADIPQLLALVGAGSPGPVSIDGERPLTLTIRVSPRGGLTATGAVDAARISAGSLVATGVRAPLRYDGHALTLDPLTLEAFSGSLSGRFMADTASTPATWRLTSTMSGVDASAFLAALGPGGHLEGRGEAQVDVRAEAGVPLERSLAGTVNVSLTDGVIRDFPLLTAFNRALRVAETAGRDTAFSSLTAPMTVGSGALRTSGLRLVATDVTVLATGSLTFARRLDMDGTAVFSPEKSRELIRRVHELSGLRNARGEVEVPFDIAGPLEDPSVTIDLASILGTTLQKELERQFKRRLERIIR